LLYLIGPMIYWYTRSVLNDNSRLKKTDLLHLMPAVIFFVTSLPYIFSPYQEKLKVTSELVKNIDYMGIYKPTILYKLLSNQIIFLTRPLLVLAYTVVSIRMLFRYLRSGETKYIFSRQQYMKKWLLILLGFLLILAISHSLLIVETVEEKSSRLLYTLNFMQVFSAIGLSGLLISPLFFPTILYGLPVIPPVPLISVNTKRSDIYDKREVHRAKLPVFEAAYLKQMKGTIESSMVEQQVYLQKDLNLTQLSVLTQIPAHHVAYFFREHLNQSFHDYRNEWRIEHAKRLILEGKAKELTLEAIGSLSGFSSRNAFFIAFKRVEGISPREFTSRIVKNY
jgi:AraC-like DNA-binding protein